MVYYIELISPLHVSEVKQPSSGEYHMLQLPCASKQRTISYVTKVLTYKINTIAFVGVVCIWF
jgi:hypothetical protein